MQKQRKKTNKDLKESKKSNKVKPAMDDERETKEFIQRLKLQRRLLRNFIDPAAAGLEDQEENQEPAIDQEHTFSGS